MGYQALLNPCDKYHQMTFITKLHELNQAFRMIETLYNNLVKYSQL
jgi:hypothetical protein